MKASSITNSYNPRIFNKIYTLFVVYSSEVNTTIAVSSIKMDTIFKQNLREELSFQDITVKDLSYRTAISQRTLEGYLGSRSSMPPADAAVRIAAALNVTVEYLVTGKKSGNEDFDSEEKKIINNIRKLSQRDKRIILRMSEDFLNIH